jgi:hypothetical protein
MVGVNGNVLMVGSIPLADTEAVLGALSNNLDGHLPRYPDGETGPRSKFITWQAFVLGAAEQFTTGTLPPQSEWGPDGQFPPRIIHLKPNATGTPAFGPTGYAAEAIKSFDLFRRFRDNGKIPSSARFQVGLPTPIGVLSVFMEPDGQALADGPYTESLMADLAAISAAVPATDLCVQWDVPTEISIWEGNTDTSFADPRNETVARLVTLMNLVPAGAELGMHICYGDISHQHWKDPDVGVMVAFTNAVRKKLTHTLDYVHFPVPHDWDTAEHFAGYDDLELDPETEIFLGLVHAADGVDGARRRIDAAGQILGSFGVATSCGLGRREPHEIDDILRLHADIARLG